MIPTAWRIAAVVDYDGGGDVDIFWENTVTGDRGIWLMDRTTYAGLVGLGVIPSAWRIAH